MYIKEIVLIIMLLFFPHYAIGNDPSGIAKENQLLKDEWSLAQKPNLYVIFHLKEKTIQIKAKGVTLREFPIHDIYLWGKNLPGSSLLLVKKSALVKPSRAIIRPGDMKEAEDVTLDVLELEDMPARYTLVLDNRIFIAIRPSEGVASKFGNMLSSLKNFMVRPAITFWYAVRGKQYTALDLGLEKQDAKALYWSFPEGTKSVVYPP
jgi:hypothetical protein